MGILRGFLQSFQQISREGLEIRPGCFLPHPLQFIIQYDPFIRLI
jgi:hypothetical protein